MTAGQGSRDSNCPFCGQPTAIGREEHRPLPGGLAVEEFGALVRGEWRRRLGRESYWRSHPGALIRALSHVGDSEKADAALADAVEHVLADLRSEGSGREEVRHELGVLVRAMRAVLRRAGVEAAEADRFVEPLRERLDRVLDWPQPEATVWTGASRHEGGGGVRNGE